MSELEDGVAVGFVGVGLMGHGMAKNLVEKGHSLTIVGNRNRAPGRGPCRTRRGRGRQRR